MKERLTAGKEIQASGKPPALRRPSIQPCTVV